jgi:putative pyruvate formate lyase activating enzyme
MSQCPQLPPVVWKSDFHGTPQAFELLDGVVDVYVADFKFGNDECARRLAGIQNYTRIITRNLKIAASQSKLIIRHLLLPGHAECCYRPIVSWLHDNLPSVPLSLRDGYLPSWRAWRFADIAHPLIAGQGEEAEKLADRMGLTVIQ